SIVSGNVSVTTIKQRPDATGGDQGWAVIGRSDRAGEVRPQSYDGQYPHGTARYVQLQHGGDRRGDSGRDGARVRGAIERSSRECWRASRCTADDEEEGGGGDGQEVE